MEFKNWKRKQKTKEKIEYFEKSTKFILIQYKSKKKKISQQQFYNLENYLCNHHISHKKSIILITKLLIFLFKEDKH